jgi:hypothetical protein
VRRREAQADVNGALNIWERAFPVSPVKGRSGRVARPVVVSFQLGGHTVHAPKRKGLRASAGGCARIYSEEDVTSLDRGLRPCNACRAIESRHHGTPLALGRGRRHDRPPARRRPPECLGFLRPSNRQARLAQTATGRPPRRAEQDRTHHPKTHRPQGRCLRFAGPTARGHSSRNQWTNFVWRDYGVKKR